MLLANVHCSVFIEFIVVHLIAADKADRIRIGGSARPHQPVQVCRRGGQSLKSPPMLLRADELWQAWLGQRAGLAALGLIRRLSPVVCFGRLWFWDVVHELPRQL